MRFLRFGPSGLLFALALTPCAYSTETAFTIPALPDLLSGRADLPPDLGLQLQAFQQQVGVWASAPHPQLATSGPLPATASTVALERIHAPSLFPRPAEHASHDWVADLYLPTDASTGPLPTVLLIHHIANDQVPEQRMCERLAQMKVACALLYLPLYGPRTMPGTPFLQPDLNAVYENFAQAYLDLWSLRAFLEQDPRLDSAHLSLWGISLGSMIGAASLGMFPAWSGGAILALVAGQMPEILLNFAPSQFNPFQARMIRFLGPTLTGWMDPQTWAPFTRTHRLLMFRMTEDEVALPRLYAGWLDLVRTNAPSTEITEYAYPGRHADFANHLEEAVSHAFDFINSREL